MPGRVARLGQCRIQAPHRGCVAQSAGRQARPVLQPALPVARRGRAVAAAAAERLSRSTSAKRRIEFLYKCVGRGTNGLATLKRGDDLNMVGPLGVGFSVDPGWKHIVVLGRGVGLATLAPISQLAGESGIGVTAILSARSPEFVMAGDLFAKVGDVISVLDTDGTQRGRERRGDPRAADRPAKRPTPSTPAARTGCLQLMKRVGKAARHSRPGGHGAGHGLRARALLRLRAHLRGGWQEGASARVHRRPGVRSAGGVGW